MPERFDELSPNFRRGLHNDTEAHERSTLQVLSRSQAAMRSLDVGSVIGSSFAESGEMFFRFGAALLLVVCVALAGTALETQNLALKRSLSQQQYRLEALMESQARLRLETQRLGATARLYDVLEGDDATLYRPPKPQRADQRRAPLLNWSSPPVPGSQPHTEPQTAIRD